MVLDFALWIIALECTLDVVIIKFVVDAMDNLLEEPDKGYDLSRSLFFGCVARRKDGYRLAVATRGHFSTDVALLIVPSETAPSTGTSYLEGQTLRFYPRK